MSMFSKVKRYTRKLDRASGEFMGYLEENPLVAVGLTLAVGTMASAMSGGKAEDVATRPARRRRRAA
ncbi:MAG: hypothetical protein E4H19_11460 [Chromatiales bacterium]|nr:MAG: hypothetical protein E4H19_11460 [Chromatiales bacterium]